MIAGVYWVARCDACRRVTQVETFQASGLDEVRAWFAGKGWTFNGDECHCPDCKDRPFAGVRP